MFAHGAAADADFITATVRFVCFLSLARSPSLSPPLSLPPSSVSPQLSEHHCPNIPSAVRIASDFLWDTHHCAPAPLFFSPRLRTQARTDTHIHAYTAGSRRLLKPSKSSFVSSPDFIAPPAGPMYIDAFKRILFERLNCLKRMCVCQRQGR